MFDWNWGYEVFQIAGRDELAKRPLLSTHVQYVFLRIRYSSASTEQLSPLSLPPACPTSSPFGWSTFKSTATSFFFAHLLWAHRLLKAVRPCWWTTQLFQAPVAIAILQKPISDGIVEREGKGIRTSLHRLGWSLWWQFCIDEMINMIESLQPRALHGCKDGLSYANAVVVATSISAPQRFPFMIINVIWWGCDSHSGKEQGENCRQAHSVVWSLY